MLVSVTLAPGTDGAGRVLDRADDRRGVELRRRARDAAGQQEKHNEHA